MGQTGVRPHGESDMSCQKCVGPLPAASMSRRDVLGRFGMGLGGIALANLVNPMTALAQDRGILGGQLHVPARAKRIIYLFMAGGPSQMETFDYKPLLSQRNGEQLPDSVRQGQRLTGMSGNQSSLPLAGSKFGFSRHGANGTWVSDLLPHTARIVDDLCIVRSMYTEAINHDPAITFFQTGSQIAGRPSMGAGFTTASAATTQNLPAFVVLITPGKVDQPLVLAFVGQRLPASRNIKACSFAAGKDPVLYLANPDGVSRDGRRLMLDRLRELHAHAAERQRRCRRSTRASRNTRWLSACKPACLR